MLKGVMALLERLAVNEPGVRLEDSGPLSRRTGVDGSIMCERDLRIWWARDGVSNASGEPVLANLLDDATFCRVCERGRGVPNDGRDSKADAVTEF